MQTWNVEITKNLERVYLWLNTLSRNMETYKNAIIGEEKLYLEGIFAYNFWEIDWQIWN